MDGVVVVAFVVQIGAKFVGGSFFSGANQAAASQFGAPRSDVYRSNGPTSDVGLRPDVENEGGEKDKYKDGKDSDSDSDDDDDQPKKKKRKGRGCCGWIWAYIVCWFKKHCIFGVFFANHPTIS